MPPSEAPLTAHIRVQPGLPYFLAPDGSAWTPIGHNDAVTWPELSPLFRRRDVQVVERHLEELKAYGVTCIRLMLEYCHGKHRYFERPVGKFVPNMVRLWDDLFTLLERVGLRVLLTPFDTFFMWLRWGHHPYNRVNGGVCAKRSQWLTCPDTRAAIKNRLAFATDRWGNSPALFAWDIWNEIHPAHGGNEPATVAPFVDDLSFWLRDYESQRHGRANLQTVSIFGPELIRYPELGQTIFQHPTLDFANTHLYQHGTIDDPKDTVKPALAVADLMRSAVIEAGTGRPVFDSEHGPIHSFKDRKRTLPATFDDEYFRHIQWAHLASGGAGGGMRWPNRHPHVLTTGMRQAQRALTDFLPLIDWTNFRRQNLRDELCCEDPGVVVVGCSDEAQALAWLVRNDSLAADGTIKANNAVLPTTLKVPGLKDGRYNITLYDTACGKVVRTLNGISTDRVMNVSVGCIVRDIAVAIRADDAGDVSEGTE